MTDLFATDIAWQLSRSVGLRPEPFGALAYHFDTRRLVFLKTPELVDLVNDLESHDSIDAALDNCPAVTSSTKRTSYTKALASLAEAGVIEEQT